VRLETTEGGLDILVQTDDAEVKQQMACASVRNQLISGEKIHGKRHIESTSQISTRVHMNMSSLARKENAKAKEHPPLLPDAKNLKPNEIGTLLHEVFSGIQIETVLRRYGILCEANITACQNHYSRFLQLPELQRVRKEYTELSCCLTVVDQNSPHHYHLQGAIDRLCKTDNGWILIDYKTGEGDPMQFQLVLEAYRRAAEHLVKESVTAYQYNIVSHELVLTDSMEDGLFTSLVAAEGSKLLS
jgi:ATP-dependent exoDNAse (exonuclease V) beta subunit